MNASPIRPVSFSRVRVRYAGPDGAVERVFETPFRIGREAGCDVCIQNGYVSRVHVEVNYADGQWIAKDLKSSNGVYANGQRMESVALGSETSIRLGGEGPEISLAVEVVAAEEQKPGEHTIVANYIAHYFDDGKREEPVGEHTMFVRRAFQQVQRKQRRKYGKVVAALAILLVAAAAFGIYEHLQNRKQRMLAENLFYSMKSLDVDIANVEKLVLQNPNQQGAVAIKRYQTRRKEMEKDYDRFLATLHVYDPRMTAQERLILRVARIFGECELAMPAGICDGDQQLHQKMAVIGTPCCRDTKGQGERLHCRNSTRSARPGPASAILLFGTAGEQFRPLYQRPHDTQGHRERHVAVHSGDRH